MASKGGCSPSSGFHIVPRFSYSNTQLTNSVTHQPTQLKWLSHSPTNRPNWVLGLILRPKVSWPVCIGIKHPSGAYNQIFITLRQLQFCWCGALSLMRGPVYHLQLLLVLASTVILGSNSSGTRDHILLSQIRDFPFHHLLWLTGLQRTYSTSLHTGYSPLTVLLITFQYGPHWKHRFYVAV
jgi:hypothetical protein